MNWELVDLVAGFAEPAVRVVPVWQRAGQLGPDEDPVPDGMHYSPRMRRVLSDWIAAEIDAAWVERNR
jgi:hypothetical protein